MESLALATTSTPRSQHSGSRSKSQLIREWIGKLALNAGQGLDATAIGVYQALWEEGFEDLSYEVLQAAFKKALREGKFWPIKVADIRQHVDCAHEAATHQVAELEWQRMLDLRLRYWAPDMPGGFLRGMPKLSDRVQRAADASGVFKLQDCEPDVLHVWGKKRFVESYVNSEKADKFLLPEGELKNLIAGVAEAKTLPAGDQFSISRERGLDYARRIKGLKIPSSHKRLWSSPEEREAAYKALGI
jgi:hypothetical protein